MNTLLRILGYGVQGFKRNIWLSVIAIITMTMTLMTLTIFVVGDLVATKKYQEFSENIDYVVFVKDQATDQDINLFVTSAETQKNVVSTRVLSKQDARLEFDKYFKDNATFRGMITDDNNPLPRQIKIKFSDPGSISDFNSFVKQDRYKDLIESTSYQQNQDGINNYVKIMNFLKVFGLSFTGFFMLISILVILNTIRLTIYARRSEVEVMRLVGATQGYIRGPFIIEGLLFGLIGALVSAIISWVVIVQIDKFVTQSFDSGMTNTLVDLFNSTLRVNGVSNVAGLLTYLFIIQLAAGLALGTACSILAIRRYLKE